MMTINFNFKRYIKYIIIFIICFIFMHSFTNAKAYTNLNNNYIVDFNTRNYYTFTDYMNNGGLNELNYYYINNFNKYGVKDVYNNIKQKIAGYRGYNSWTDLTNDFYYITYFNINPDYSLDISMGIVLKSSSVADLLHPALSFSSINNSSPNNSTNFDLILGISYQSYGYHWEIPLNQSFYLDPGGNLGVSGSYKHTSCNHTNPTNDSSYCYTNTSSNITHVYLTTTGGNKIFNLYWDTNKSSLDLYLSTLTNALSNDYYVFQRAIFNNNTNNVVNIFNKIDVDFSNDDIIYIEPNIQDFDNNSFGLETNDVIVSFRDNSQSPTFVKSIGCPADRQFSNNICYIYNTDVEDFNFNNLNYFNSVRFYLGDNSNIPLRENYYYIFTFRVYSPYNLNVNNIRVSSGSSNNPVDIEDVITKDYFIYRDYQVIFTPNISGDFAVNFIDIYFDKYINYTNILPEDISFGVYNFIKYSEFDSLPSTDEINNNYNTNNLDNISSNNNSSFFTNFKINDRGLSQFITLPLSYISSFKNSTCSPISLPFPHLSNFTVPCMSSVLSNNVPAIWNMYVILINGFVIYRILVNLLGDIKNINKPDNDRIEVVDL